MVGRRGPGLLGTVARTAVVAGTATATANAVSDRQARRTQAADEQAQRPDQQPASGPAAQQATNDESHPAVRQGHPTEVTSRASSSNWRT
jgi:hypothetical protein